MLLQLSRTDAAFCRLETSSTLALLAQARMMVMGEEGMDPTGLFISSAMKESTWAEASLFTWNPLIYFVRNSMLLRVWRLVRPGSFAIFRNKSKQANRWRIIIDIFMMKICVFGIREERPFVTWKTLPVVAKQRWRLRTTYSWVAHQAPAQCTLRACSESLHVLRRIQGTCLESLHSMKMSCSFFRSMSAIEECRGSRAVSESPCQPCIVDGINFSQFVPSCSTKNMPIPRNPSHDSPFSYWVFRQLKTEFLGSYFSFKWTTSFGNPILVHMLLLSENTF
jgi:hypothetical protein